MSKKGLIITFVSALIASFVALGIYIGIEKMRNDDDSGDRGKTVKEETSKTDVDEGRGSDDKNEEGSTQLDPVILNDLTEDSEIVSPLKVEGKALSSWFSDGKISVKLVNYKNETLAFTEGVAKTSTSGENYVEFEAVLEFAGVEPGKADLVFEPKKLAGDSETSKEYEIDVEIEALNLEANKKVYTNPYYPNLRLVYDDSWDFETSTSWSGVEDYVDRTIELSKYKGGNNDYDSEGVTLTIHLSPIEHNYQSVNQKVGKVLVYDDLVYVIKFGDAGYSVWDIIPKSDCGKLDPIEHGNYYEGSCNILTDNLEDFKRLHEDQEYFSPDYRLYQKNQTIIEDFDYIGYYNIEISSRFISDFTEVNEIIKNSSF